MWATFLFGIRDWVIGLMRARRVGNMLSTAAALAVVVYFPFDQFVHTSAGVVSLELVRLVLVMSRFVSGQDPALVRVIVYLRLDHRATWIGHAAMFSLSALHPRDGDRIFIGLNLGESCAWLRPMPMTASPAGVVTLLKASR
jgi:hypothetical protein